VSGKPDPKRGKRIVDPKVFERARLREPWCVICEDARTQSIHHVVKRSQGGDDVPANLVGLCGDGTRGCHGRVEAREKAALRRLAEYLMTDRDDFLDYLTELHKGDGDRALAWMVRNLGVEFGPTG
jgi:hypothetical protein